MLPVSLPGDIGSRTTVFSSQLSLLTAFLSLIVCQGFDAPAEYAACVQEHLEEASRIAMAENARRRGTATAQSATSTVSSVSTPREVVRRSFRFIFSIFTD